MEGNPDRQPGLAEVNRKVNPHFHGGFAAFAQTVVYTVIGVNLWRLGAAKLAAHPKTEAIGKALGSLVTWGGTR